MMKEKEEKKGDEDSQLSEYHTPVLLKEAIDGLNIKPNGVYVDCTFGGGGHARAILNLLGDEGRLIAFDQDEDAKRNLTEDKRILFIPHNFRHLKRFLQLNAVMEVDGVLADLGVSSHQFNEAGRGFSTRFEGAFDMRMDRRQQKTAFEIVNTYSEQKLQKLFEQYGEVTNAKTLAKKIVEARNTSSMATIEGFKNVVSVVVKGNPNKYFAQVFQALRIEVNEELEALKELLMQLPDVIKTGGRVAIITFHSLEDRLVKIFFRDGTFETVKDENPFSTEVKAKSVFKLVNKKPIEATEEEVRINPRSRSAKLRVAEKRST